MTPDQLPPYWREVYEERAAIMQHDGKLSRMVAEAFALRDVERQMKLKEGHSED
jgi:hypothetical protein